MVVTRRLEIGSRFGSGAGSQDRPALSEDCVSEIIREEVIRVVREKFPVMFGSIKTAMVEYFDEHYAAIAETVAMTALAVVTMARGGARQAFQY